MKLHLLFVFYLLCVYSAMAQVDTIRLNEVDVSDFRLQSIQQTARFAIPDTSIIKRIDCNSLSDLLIHSGAAFIKDNGGGRLSTLSIRGTTASQNSVTWNGLAVNTPTLGLCDVSLMPVFFIDRVSLQYGGNGSLNGSAAIGGAVHLSSAPVFNDGWRAQVLLSAASFNDYQQGRSVSYSGKKYFTRTALYHHDAINNYNFKDIYLLGSPERKQVHASVRQYGILHEHSLLLKNNLISLHCMFLDAEREIPPQMGSLRYQSEQIQKDKQLRIVAEWKNYGRQLQTLVRFGYLNDKIEYADDFVMLDDKSNGHTIQGEAEATYKINNHHLQGGVLMNSTRAYVNSELGDEVQGYPSKHTSTRTSVYVLYKYVLKKYLTAQVSLRKDLEAKNYPFFPSAGLKLSFNKYLSLFANAAAIYRAPTLNDLYWKPGGNPLLNPEKGFQTDTRLGFVQAGDKFSFSADAGFFYMNINNWIQWAQLNDNDYTPVNIGTVIIKGAEFSGKINYKTGKWNLNSAAVFENIIANATNGFGNNAAILDKQLIYVPKIRWRINESLRYINTTLAFEFGYNGHRYTNADNSTWLNPYTNARLSLSQEMNFNFGDIFITASADNVFNETYEVVALRPMPGRWYKISLMVDLHSSKK